MSDIINFKIYGEYYLLIRKNGDYDVTPINDMGKYLSKEGELYNSIILMYALSQN